MKAQYVNSEVKNFSFFRNFYTVDMVVDRARIGRLVNRDPVEPLRLEFLLGRGLIDDFNDRSPGVDRGGGGGFWRLELRVRSDTLSGFSIAWSRFSKSYDRTGLRPVSSSSV